MLYTEKWPRVPTGTEEGRPSFAFMEQEGALHKGNGFEGGENKKGDVPGKQEHLRRGRAQDASLGCPGMKLEKLMPSLVP